MTTLTVLAALAAAPLLFGVFLAVALGGYMLVRFAPDLVPGCAPAPRRAYDRGLAETTLVRGEREAQGSLVREHRI
jgi:hypothetical protein